MKMLQCVCGSTFHTLEEKQEHVREEHGNGYKCGFIGVDGKSCEKVLSCSSTYVRHRRHHTGVYNYHCTLCTWSGDEYDPYLSHLVKKHQFNIEGGAKCPFCKRVFVNRRYLKHNHLGDGACQKEMPAKKGPAPGSIWTRFMADWAFEHLRDFSSSLCPFFFLELVLFFCLSNM